MRISQLNWRRLSCIAVLLIALQNIIHLIACVVDPLQLDYSEGLVLGGLQRIAANPALGAAYSFNAAFYNTTDLAYPPVFPYAAAGLARLLGTLSAFGDPSGTLTTLYAARALTLGSLAVAGLLIYRLTRLLGSGRWVAAAAAGLFFCFHPAIYWGVYARVDALGLALVLAALYLVALGEKSKEPGRVYLLAVPLFGLAFFTKQSLLAAPAAVAIYLWWAGRRWQALLFAVLLAGLGGAGIAALALATDGKYFFFLTIERFTPFSLAKMLKTWGLFVALYAPLAGAWVWAGWKALRQGGGQGQGGKVARLVALWGGLAGLVSLTVGKAGAADYYFFEVMAAGCILVGGLIGNLPSEVLTGRRARLWQGAAILQVAVLLGLGVWLDYPANDRDAVRSADGQAAAYVRQYAGTEGQVFAEMSGPVVAAGRPDQIFDHFIFRQLAQAGQRDGQALVQDFARKRFKLALFGYDVLRYDLRPDVTEPSPWPPGFEEAVRTNYRLLQNIRGSDGRPYAWALVPK